MTADRELERLLSDCRFTTSPEQEQRIMDDIADVMKDRPAGIPFGQRSTGTIGLRLAVVVCLAVVILVGFLLREQPQAVVWAEVQKKVAEQEWIHIVWKGNDGETSESWSSIPLQIEASKFVTSSGKQHLRFVDFKNGIQEQYDPGQHVVARSTRIFPIQRKSFESFEAMNGLFAAVTKGDKSVDVKLPDTEIVSQESRAIERDGKKWLEFELNVRGRKEPDVASRMVFLIEPETRLIRSMQVFSGEQQATAVFSYPETGPKSVYDIGAPKTAKFIDLTPDTEVLKVIAGVRTSADNFGPYTAINVMQDPKAPWYVGTPFKVWADGRKIRLEIGLVDPAHDQFEKPEPSADQKQWWFERWNQLWHFVVEISDGEKLYSNIAEPDGWGTQERRHPMAWDPKNWPEPRWQTGNLPFDDWPIAVAGSALFFAYHPNTSQHGRGDSKPVLEKNAENGPAGTVLLAYPSVGDDPRFGSTERFWIDLQRSHIVMRYELTNGPPPGKSGYTVTIKEVAKSPRGVWYPTLVSHKSVSTADGTTTMEESVTRHYFDFDTRFPDGVFETNSLQTGSTNISDGEQQKTAEFPFPESGPQPIHDAASPETGQASGSSPSDEILKLIDNVRSSAEKFGPYFSINVLQDDEAPWYVGTPFKVWADGIKERKETGFVDPNRDTFQKPDRDADRKRWWFERWNQLWHMIDHVSDGKKEYHNTAVPEGWTGMGAPFPPLAYPPEDWPAPAWESYIPFQDRPMPTNSPLRDAYDTKINLRRIKRSAKPTLETNPAAGPEGTVLLTLKFNMNSEREFIERFWIDPRRSYIVMQYEHLSGKPPTVTSRRVIEELKKSPRGIWYPTRIRYQDYVKQDNGTGVIEHITRHYLDFDTEFPDGVFEPKPLPDAE